MTNSSLQSGTQERSDEEKVRLCAANNADLYQAIFRAHGLPDQRTSAFWTSDAVAPPYYSNMTATWYQRRLFQARSQQQRVPVVVFRLMDLG
ncbi:hypothetical protein [Rhizobium leguminosarum]|uniref:hypothetical protein n=1 Tax=Rhizobium leguminosarum TaxID=384 RepID=UPI001FDF3504|nr:hypothetical protein [Rhizobium leguminosarum]